MPWRIAQNAAGCSGWAVVNANTGRLVGCHKTREDALRQLAALNANVTTGRETEVAVMAEVDNSAWDAARAMRQCSTAAEYGRICAGKKAGDPSLRASWSLPHHYLSRAPVPNAGGTRAALAALGGARGGVKGLTNAGAARSHLEAHMRQINPDYKYLPDEFDAALLAKDDKVEFRVAAPIEGWTFAASGSAGTSFNISGYATVFGQRSHDLGGFRTVIDPHALDEALASDPDVHFLWDHDTRFPLARTKNGTLHLTADEHGLFIEAAIGTYSYAKDLRVALERGDVDQASMAIGIGEDSWEVDDDDELVRTVLKANGLHDVTVTAQGAFPQTNLEVAYSLAAAARATLAPPSTTKLTMTTTTSTNYEPPAVTDLPVAPDEGGSSSREAGDEGAENRTRRALELRNLFAVRRDELDRLIERSRKL